MMNIVKKQIAAALLLSMHVCVVHAAANDDKALVGKAREFALQLRQFGNVGGSALVTGLADRVEHLSSILATHDAVVTELPESATIGLTEGMAPAASSSSSSSSSLSSLSIQSREGYPCEICGKSYATVWHLQRHEKSERHLIMVSGEKNIELALEKAKEALICARRVAASSGWTSAIEKAIGEMQAELAAQRASAASSSSSNSSSSSSSSAASSSSSSVGSAVLSPSRFSQAIKLYEEKKWVEALEAFKLVETNPSEALRYRALALNYAGQIYQFGGNGVERDSAKALDYYNQAIALKPFGNVGGSASSSSSAASSSSSSSSELAAQRAPVVSEPRAKRQRIQSPEVYCQTCGMTLSSRSNYNAHIKTQKHKINEKGQQTLELPVPTRTSVVSSVASGEGVVDSDIESDSDIA